MLAAAPSFAAESVSATLTVTGKLSPGACNVSLDGGGSIDYGNIAAASLKKSDYTALNEQARALRVVCGSLTNAYVSVMDNRSASAIADAAMKQALGSDALTDTQVFGLGTTGGTTAANIGAYTIKLGRATTTDLSSTATQQAAVLTSGDKRTWTASTDAVAMTKGGATYYSAGGADTGSTPAQGKTFVFPVTVKAALNNTTDMPVSSKIALDGSATFTVSYN
ncbi:hypothetical protein WJ96_20255 [Burkholderia ubonensis]|uniref:DUF1120 domain-containing protein n=3 Tax=Burkholderia ubonensis TaxID=101571 RepID=A0AAW3MK30_9BURK|nr:hypothetical protein WJ96_20255 [Burkholderia ubonensis]